METLAAFIVLCGYATETPGVPVLSFAPTFVFDGEGKLGIKNFGPARTYSPPPLKQNVDGNNKCISNALKPSVMRVYKLKAIYIYK